MRLLDGILELMEGGAPMTPSVANRVLNFFKVTLPKNTKSDVKLTPREKKELKLPVEGYNYKMIGEKCFVTYATVNKHITHIYLKLQVNSVAAAGSKALKEGLG